MPVVKIADASDDTIQLLEYEGTRYAYTSTMDQESAIKASRSIEPFHDDVLLITYPKSGTHWLWEVLSMLQNRKAEIIPKIKQENMIEFVTHEQLLNIPSPRVLNAHFRFDQVPTPMKEKKTKIVLCHRNPKDVAVSLYNHHYGLKHIYEYDGKWENWLPLYMEGQFDYGSWFDYVQDWEKAMKENSDHPIHTLTFEDMKQNGGEEVKKLAQYLNIDADDELCHAIAEACQFSNMKTQKEQYATEFWNKMWRSDTLSYYRKGEVGDWKNMFTVAQNEQFDKLYEQKMAGSGLKFKFE